MGRFQNFETDPLTKPTEPRYNIDMDVKVRVVCEKCGSDDVAVDATAYWNYDMQDWQLQATHDAAYCNVCDSETTLLSTVE